ncbi:hypothetical protein Y1Q_0017980 [Alligator mississippiensis]|uniref:Uncharacterized protein n=1 Tax=Alligator mississippiensis TaxID=8496 RepID=A0A151MXV0_ALLMI|nr:hypothetical protein Y1Q_0017980 [Alligator mississippiensis]
MEPGLLTADGKTEAQKNATTLEAKFRKYFIYNGDSSLQLNHLLKSTFHQYGNLTYRTRSSAVESGLQFKTYNI